MATGAQPAPAGGGVTATRLSNRAGSAFRFAGPRWRALALLPAWLAAIPAAAGQIGAAAAQPADGNPAPEDYNGLDYTRPQQDANLRLRFLESSSPTSRTDQERIYLRLGTKIDVPEGWQLGLQGQAPFVDKEVTKLATANVTRTDGLGDSFAQAALSHDIDRHWAYGFGIRVEAPTGGDALGSGKWQAMPGLGVRYSLKSVRTRISCRCFAGRSAFPAILRNRQSISRRSPRPSISACRSTGISFCIRATISG